MPSDESRCADAKKRDAIDAAFRRGDLEALRAAGQDAIAGLLAAEGQPVRRRLRPGVTLLVDVPGSGELVRRLQTYRIRLRLWLHHGEPVRWTMAAGPVGVGRLEDDGTTLVTEWRIDRRTLIPGLFYGIEGMRVGGTRRLEIAPHLAYGETGIPGQIPPNALLLIDVSFIPY